VVIEFAARSAGLSISTRQTIVQKAGGNPFFLEELTKALVEYGSHDLSSSVPDTIQGVLMARIDRLPPATKHVMQIASVLGQEFSLKLLAAVYTEHDDLSAHLVTLTALEFLHQLAASEPRYVFRHALVQEVTYESLLMSRRQVIHEMAGRELELHYDFSSLDRSVQSQDQSLTSAPIVDLIAYHYSRSLNHVKEAQYCRLAGEHAIRKGAYDGAHEYVRRALEIVCAMPLSAEKAARELGLRLSLGTILLVIRGQGSTEAKEVYDSALCLCREMDPSQDLARALFGIWTYYIFQGLMTPAEETVREFIELSDISDDHGIEIMAQLAASMTYLWMGEWHKCLEHADNVNRLYDPARHSSYITNYTQNPRFTVMGSQFWANFALGYSDKALAMVLRAIDEAKGFNHDFTFVIAFVNKPLLFYFQDRIDKLAESIGELMMCAQRAGSPFYIGLARVLEGFLKVAQGCETEGLDQIVQQRNAMQAAGLKLTEPLVVTMLAQACLRSGRYVEGLKVLDDSYGVFVSNAQFACLAEHLRVRGELLLALDASDQEAEDCFRQAIEVARRQSAKSWEIRSALSLARLLVHRNRRDEAQSLLSPLYEWFTEGLDAPDMVEIVELLSGGRTQPRSCMT
jgi:predicted ATPase